MNFFVHSFMYTYFLARSLKISVPGWISRSITGIQIAQFVTGVYITAIVLYREVFIGDNSCDCTYYIAWGQFLLYSSYLVLFVNFFYHSYLKPKPKKKTE